MRYLMTFSYDGSNYNGYQKQPNKNTVQNKIEEALKKITSTDITIHSSGRTDSKVHALCAKAHFDLEKTIEIDKLKKSINSLIPEDIYIKKIEEVDDSFHARFNVIEKRYLYKINMGEYNPIERNYVYQLNKTLDIVKIKEAKDYLIGTHNFKAFTKTDITKEDYIRTIYDIKTHEKDNILSFEFIGSGFLRYMVRNMVGTLIEIGENKLKPTDILNILESEDRKTAGKTAPAVGLYLKDVKY